MEEGIKVKTKIVATVGPQSSSEEILRALFLEGVDVFRINFSHGTQEEHLEKIKKIRQIERDLGKKVSILQDLQGPKIRLQTFENGKAYLESGSTFILSKKDIVGNEKVCSITFGDILEDVNIGEKIYINDGLVRLVVKEKHDSEVITEVVAGGEVSDHKGLNFPETRVSIPALTAKDILDLRFGIDNGIDLVALSFVKGVQDILLAKDYMKKFGRTVPIVAKVERWEAVNNIKEIIKEADAVMVARGDLGVELPIEKVPIIQKEIISLCNECGKPVITATQMLSSMTENLTPTRAEVTDVANAIFDGTDAVMLSNETAIGKYPSATVRMMRKIIAEIEESKMFRESIERSAELLEGNISDAIAYSATEVSRLTSAKLIICATESGKTAILISKHKPNIPILALTPFEETLRFLNLKWGVFTFKVRVFKSVDEILSEGPKIAKELHLIKSGEVYVITAGSHAGISGSTNLLKVDKA